MNAGSIPGLEEFEVLSQSATKSHNAPIPAAYNSLGCCLIRNRIRVERRHHLQSVCLQDVVLVDQTDENQLGLNLVGQCYSIHLTAQT
ncbi:hypothetical protein AVEN_38002-1 [Araneus ventricosus]|uniref:Uncharacterized protein n=1 Tax=Araneus ventricosus TaxID=182803 RepID=A0A4Y2J1J5_ARAVE|nr:hypothetical protein AVEN_260304-1 [Araneus ventricosus]GBM83780.1 hypothetical protein AVEN_38002-1 [Araneus ventricosus]